MSPQCHRQVYGAHFLTREHSFYHSLLRLLVFGSLLATTGCGVLPPRNATANEPRVVQAASDAAKTLTVSESMVWYANSSQEFGVRFLQGTYVLEAEDDDYWYFRAPEPLEFRHLARGSTTDQYTSLGGLMLAKQTLRAVPAGGYLEVRWIPNGWYRGWARTFWPCKGDNGASPGEQNC
jgi:hypothetical protein